MKIYDTKKEAIEAMRGRDIRLVKVEGGWALMEWSEYAIWLKQRGIDNEDTGTGKSKGVPI